MDIIITGSYDPERPFAKPTRWDHPNTQDLVRTYREEYGLSTHDGIKTNKALRIKQGVPRDKTPGAKICANPNCRTTATCRWNTGVPEEGTSLYLCSKCFQHEVAGNVQRSAETVRKNLHRTITRHGTRGKLEYHPAKGDPCWHCETPMTGDKAWNTMSWCEEIKQWLCIGCRTKLLTKTIQAFPYLERHWRYHVF